MNKLISFLFYLFPSFYSIFLIDYFSLLSLDFYFDSVLYFNDPVLNFDADDDLPFKVFIIYLGTLIFLTD